MIEVKLNGPKSSRQYRRIKIHAASVRHLAKQKDVYAKKGPAL